MSTNYSLTLTTTPQQIMPAVSALPNPEDRSYIKIFNAAATGGGTAWLTHFGSNPAPNSAGSYAVLPGATEEFNGAQAANLASYCPQSSIWGVASTGTVPITVEVSAA